MDYTEAASRVVEIRKTIDQLYEELGELRKAEKTLQKVFDDAWLRTFKGIGCWAIATFLSEENKFGIYLYRVGQGVTFLPGNKGYAFEDPKDTPGYVKPIEQCPRPHHLLLDRERCTLCESDNAGRPRISWPELLAFTKKFSEDNPGTAVVFVEGKIRQIENSSEGVESLAQIELMHPGKTVELVGQYQKWYKGWDIADKAIEVTIDGVRWAWWSTDAHGGSMVHSACQGQPEWAKYELWMAGAEPDGE